MGICEYPAGIMEKLNAYGGGHNAFLKSLPAYVRQPITTVNNLVYVLHTPLLAPTFLHPSESGEG
jgi:hypothetical protein